jgi:hypothetical protein
MTEDKRPNAWELTGIDALACVMYLEAYYHDFHWKIYLECLADEEDPYSWDAYKSEVKFDSESTRTAFFSILGLIAG